MYYLNISTSSVDKAAKYVGDNWVNPQDTNVGKKHFLARGANFLLAPAAIVTGVADTIIGLGSGLATLATLGTNETLWTTADAHLNSSEKLLARPFFQILRTINPEASLYFNRTNYLNCTPEVAITADGHGFTSSVAIETFKGIGRSLRKSDYVFVREVSSRLNYLVMLVACVVTRVADLAIGASVGILALITAGKFVTINNIAYRALQAPGIIYDLFYCINKMANPNAGVFHNNS